MWLGGVEEEAIEPFRWECPDSTEMKILQDLVRDLKLTTPEALRNPGKETASINVPGAFEVAQLLAQNKHLHEMPFFRILPSGEIELCETWSKAVYSLENILRRTWWKRIWTAQEAFLPERAVIHVGPHTLPYATFLEAANSWGHHVHSFSRSRWENCCLPIFSLWLGYTPTLQPLAFFDSIEALKTLKDARDNLESGSVAHNLFLLAIQRSATIRHDYVYGLFGLIMEFFHLDESPNYKSDLSRVFVTTTLKFMEKAKHLCLLPYSRPHREHDPDQDRPYANELPSWCPDWSDDAWRDYFDIYNYGGFTSDNKQCYNGERQSDTILKLQGTLVGAVPVVAPLIPDMRVPPADFVPTIQAWLNLAQSKGLQPEAVWEIIHVATHQDVGLKVVESQAAWWEMLKGLADIDATFDDMQDAAKQNNFLPCVSSMNWLDKRAVFVTEPISPLSERNSDEISKYESALPQGSIGLALPFIREGDFIYIVQGGRTPFIFRPLSNASQRSKAKEAGIPEAELSNCFTLVGVCYIYGMMQGQALAENPRWKQIYLL